MFVYKSFASEGEMIVCNHFIIYLCPHLYVYVWFVCSLFALAGETQVVCKRHLLSVTTIKPSLGVWFIHIMYATGLYFECNHFICIRRRNFSRMHKDSIAFTHFICY